MSHCIYIFSDEKMFAGVKCLIYSLHCHHDRDELPIIFASTSRGLLESPFIKRYAIQRRLLDPKDYQGISVTKRQWGIATFFKGFEAFRNYGFKKNIVLDADLLCLGRLNKLWEDNDRQIRVVCDVVNRTRDKFGLDFDEYNAGMMVVDQSIQGDATVNNLIRRAKARLSFDRGDQGVLNLWAYEEKIDVEYLPQKWNMFRPTAMNYILQDDASGEIQIEDCLLLHYTAKKPWQGRHRHFGRIDQIWHNMESQRKKTEAFLDTGEVKGSE